MFTKCTSRGACLKLNKRLIDICSADSEEYNNYWVYALLLAGADPNIHSQRDGNTPLMEVIYKTYPGILEEQKAIVKILLDNGALPNIQNDNGDTALIAAVDNDILYDANSGNHKIVRLLLSSGANPNIKNNNGDFALAMSTINHKSTKLLIDYGADLNMQNNNGNTALMIASGGDQNLAGGGLEADERTITKLLMTSANVNMQNNTGNTALMLAIINEKPRMARVILNAGAKINIKNNQGQTALDLAQIAGYTKIINKITAIEDHERTKSALGTFRSSKSVPREAIDIFSNWSGPSAADAFVDGDVPALHRSRPPRVPTYIMRADILCKELRRKQAAGEIDGGVADAVCSKLFSFNSSKRSRKHRQRSQKRSKRSRKHRQRSQKRSKRSRKHRQRSQKRSKRSRKR